MLINISLEAGMLEGWNAKGRIGLHASHRSILIII